MIELIDYAGRIAENVWGTIAHNWPFLLISVVAAAALTTYSDVKRVAALLSRHQVMGIVIAVALAAMTPFCSCGTMAVVLGMMAASTPWAPLVAFMVASPLTSPSELVLSAGLLGWPFALLFFGGTIALGLTAGGVTALVERTGWLRGQARLQGPESGETGDCANDGGCAVRAAIPAYGPGAARVGDIGLRSRLRIGKFARTLLTTTRRLGLLFLGFTAVGYAVIEAIPSDFLSSYLGGDSVFAVPLAAILGVPAYINTEASLPLVAGLTAGGMSAGAAMAFLVTGAGTSIGAVAGTLVIARRRVVALVIALLFAGALSLGAVTTLLL